MEYFSLQELNLPRDIWSPFAARHQALRYRPGQIIYLQGTTAGHFYYLKSGRVKTYSSSEEGAERVLNIYHSGSLFGEASFFDELPRVSSAMAMTECAIIPIDRKMAVDEMSANPELALALLKYLARTVRLLSSQVDNMAFLRADQRLAQYLLTLPREEDGLVRCSQEELAAAVSASRVTVNRTLQRFARAGLVETEYGGVRILNPRGLAEC
ncbi:MAG: Crp/Fnr family transcriptional regulator [Clostridiales bacterium]|nr:Crp/Fnr family transcriptional regulator [Clostridiales bacterium]